jgi:hypothetical protein
MICAFSKCTCAFKFQLLCACVISAVLVACGIISRPKYIELYTIPASNVTEMHFAVIDIGYFPVFLTVAACLLVGVQIYMANTEKVSSCRAALWLITIPPEIAIVMMVSGERNIEALLLHLIVALIPIAASLTFFDTAGNTR